MRPIIVSTTTQEKFQTSCKSSTPVLMLYHASWCGHCVDFQPTWKNIKTELSTHPGIIVAEVESENMGLLPSSVSSVQGFPTLMILKDGKQLKEYSGQRTLKDVVAFAKKFSVVTKKSEEKELKSKTPKKNKTTKSKK